MLMPGDCSEYTIERANTKRLMGGNRDAMRARFIGLQDNMTAHLIYLLVAPITTKQVG